MSVEILVLAKAISYIKIIKTTFKISLKDLYYEIEIQFNGYYNLILINHQKLCKIQYKILCATCLYKQIIHVICYAAHKIMHMLIAMFCHLSSEIIIKMLNAFDTRATDSCLYSKFLLTQI